jgi:recombination protein RecA
MAKKETAAAITKTVADDFTTDLITSLNKDHGSRIAYNLSIDTSPTHVKRWISTGSKQLDLVVSNRANGGLPEGRIVEVFGPPSIGKSHIATQVAKATQQMGGIVVYIDTENGTSVENLAALGVDVSKRFVYVDTHCTEEVLDIAEKTILKAKAMAKNVPITIIWDSVAASSPKAELEGAYDKDTIGLQARSISKGMRKITGVIGDQNVLFLILNQTRTKIGVLHGDPTTTPGGMAIPFHASVRIKLGAGQHIENKQGEVIGIHVWGKTIKNKVAPPFRKVEFRIIFGKGIEEHEEVFDVLREYGPDMINNHQVSFEGTSSWKTMKVINEKNESIIEKKFYKQDFGVMWADPLYKPWIDGLLEKALIRTAVSSNDLDIDPESYEEMRALRDQMTGDISPED